MLTFNSNSLLDITYRMLTSIKVQYHLTEQPKDMVIAAANIQELALHFFYQPLLEIYALQWLFDHSVTCSRV